MPAGAAETAEQVLKTLQERWGQTVVRRGGALPDLERLPTGFAALDALLSGGVPVGRLAEFIGRPTSGKMTVALALLASAQAGGALAVLIDLAAHADPDYLARMGIATAELLLIRAEVGHALALLGDIVASRIPCAVLLDLPTRLAYRDAQQVETALRRLLLPLSQTRTLLVVLSPYPFSLARQAPLRLLFIREAWLTAEGDVTGCRVSILLRRAEGASAERAISLELAFPDSF